MKLIHYKLKYTDKETAIADFIDRGYIIETDIGESWREDIQGIVDVARIPISKATFDDEGQILTEATFKEGYHYDVYSTRDDLEFSGIVTTPINAWHKLSGEATTNEIIIE